MTIELSIIHFHYFAFVSLSFTIDRDGEACFSACGVATHEPETPQINIHDSSEATNQYQVTDRCAYLR